MDGQFGARYTCDYAALANAGFGVIFLIFNCGIFVFAENRRFQEKLEELRNKLEQGEEEQESDDQSQGIDHKRIRNVKGSVASSQGFKMLGGRT